MPFAGKRQSEGLFKGLGMAYAILGFHVILAGAVGLLVIFFRGLVNYMLWIFLAALAGIGASAYLFYRRARKQNMALKQMLKDPVFAGRSVEIRLLGGFASIRLGRQDSTPAVIQGPADGVKRLEDEQAVRLRQIRELARLLDAKIITEDEFQQARRRLLKLD